MHGSRPGQGYFFIYNFMSLKASATSPKTVAFIDGQNLFNAAKKAFGFHYLHSQLAANNPRTQTLLEKAMKKVAQRHQKKPPRPNVEGAFPFQHLLDLPKTFEESG